MLNPFILFSNLFRSHSISQGRLYAFGAVVLQALTLANDKHQFDATIATLSAALTALKSDMKNVDTGMSGQKAETRTVDEFIASFRTYMSDNEPFIAKQLGGRKSAAYLMLFPFGLSEYSNANKTTMPVLTARANTVAIKYAASLDSETAEQLLSFEPAYERQYGVQQQQIQTVKQDRTGMKQTVLQLQLALTAAVYVVGYQYPGNVEMCSSFFPFAMLYSKRRRKKYTLAGTAEKEQTVELSNYTLNKTALIVCANTGTNAAYALWLAALPTDPMPADAFVMNPTATPVIIKAETLGDITKKTFIMIKNLSDVNACSYKVTFIGLKKALKGTTVSVDDEENMEVVREAS